MTAPPTLRLASDPHVSPAFVAAMNKEPNMGPTRTKLIEVRDSGTFIPAMAIKFDAQNEQERYLLSRAGYGRTPGDQAGYVLLASIGGSHPKINCDAYDWDNNTMRQAHVWLENHWDEIESGAVLDVEFIGGRSAAPKVSEALEVRELMER